MRKDFWKWVFTNVYFYLILFVFFVVVAVSSMGEGNEDNPFLIAGVFLIPFSILVLSIFAVIHKSYFWGGMMFLLLVSLFAIFFFIGNYSQNVIENPDIGTNQDGITHLDNGEENYGDNFDTDNGVITEITPLISDSFPNAERFHFGHMPIIYKIEDPPCRGVYLDNVNSALEEIKKETNGTVYFVEGNNPDIYITCLQQGSGASGYEGAYYVERLGEGGINYYYENEKIILNSSVTLYSTLVSCGYFPFIEIHEILHAFGYDHIDKSCSIMNPEAKCEFLYQNQDICGKPHIDEEIVKDLVQTYSFN